MSELNSNMGIEDNGQSNNNNNNINANTNNSSNGMNRSGHGRLDVRFLVCSRDAGAIIGKKGSNIQTLRQKHKVIIQVPDCDVSLWNSLTMGNVSSVSFRDQNVF